MAAIMLSGEKDKYVFSVVDNSSPLPEISGFYILVKSADKYGIRDREFMAIGYSRNFNADKGTIAKRAPGYTHMYLMPDFEREPESVLQDIEVSGFLNRKKGEGEPAHSGSM